MKRLLIDTLLIGLIGIPIIAIIYWIAGQSITYTSLFALVFGIMLGFLLFRLPSVISSR